MPILELHDLASGYGDVQILWGASLALEQGKITALVGGNGVGKTTLLRTVMGLVRLQSGTVLFNGSDVSDLPAHAKAARGLVLVPEGRQLFGDMSIEENLQMGAAPQRAKPHYHTIWIVSTQYSHALPSAGPRKRRRLVAASSRCLPSHAASWRSQSS